jgi:drebrin-like protein
MQTSQGVQFPDRQVLDAAIGAVRSDGDTTTWALFGYEDGSDNLKLVGTGSGDISGLAEQLHDDQVNYGLYRTTDRYDGHLTVKFVFILWIGERVKIMRKARIATHKGAIQEFMGVCLHAAQRSV